MSTQENKITEFFKDSISPEDFAKTARRFMHVSLMLLLKNDEDDITTKEWIIDGHSILHEFCELLDPYLEEHILQK
jgi:hypothetical protein